MKKQNMQSAEDLRNYLVDAQNIRDQIPYFLCSTGMDPNELEMSLSQVGATNQIVLDMIKI